MTKALIFIMIMLNLNEEEVRVFREFKEKYAYEHPTIIEIIENFDKGFTELRVELNDAEDKLAFANKKLKNLRK